jgi:hypothetical protein
MRSVRAMPCVPKLVPLQEIRLAGEEQRRDLAPQRFEIEAPLLHRRLLGEDLAGLDRHLSPPRRQVPLEQQMTGGDFAW